MHEPKEDPLPDSEPEPSQSAQMNTESIPAVRSEERRNSGLDRRQLDQAAAAEVARIFHWEELATVRERNLQSRENAAELRDALSDSREFGIRAAEVSQAASADHMQMLQQANARLVTATLNAHRLTEEVEAAKGALDHLAHHDALTDLPNRTLLSDRLTQAIELAQRQGSQLAILFLDLDQFKHINDSLGHAVGDQLLQSVAQRLTGSVRHSDTVSRQGGDEFVLLLPLIEHADDVKIAARKMATALALPHRIGGHILHVSASIGISIYPADGRDAESLMKAADIAMYYVKESGRNNYAFFDGSMNFRATERQSIEANLRQAVERQEFSLCYQPKVNLSRGDIVGVEALIRWQHPTRGLLLPEDFLSIAEQCGLIVPIGRWVFRAACTQAQAWLKQGLPPLVVSVNASALEFQAKDFIENINSVLFDTGLAPHDLEIELTEGILMQRVAATDCVLKALADLGVKLSIDDFGTGYSSLSYLRNFPIDTLKIDRSFVADMTDNPNDATIVHAIIAMAKSLKLGVIAEGVETAEQAALLLDQQCDEAQGNYFGQAMPAEEFASLLKHRIAAPSI